MSTRKTILMEISKKIFEEFEDELWNVDDELTVIFNFTVDGFKDVAAYKTTLEEIDLEDEDEDE